MEETTTKQEAQKKVRIISLDESGNFEMQKEPIRFIGGTICDVTDYQKEKTDLENVLIDACQTFNNKKGYTDGTGKVLYPYSLHGRDTKILFSKTRPSGSSAPHLVIDGVNWYYKAINNEDKKDFTEHLWKKVSDFMKKRNYQIYAYVYPMLSNTFLEDDEMTSNILTNAEGANLYERMTELTMDGLMFGSLSDRADEYHFEFATRVVTIDEDDDDKEEKEKNMRNFSHVEKYEDGKIVKIYHVTNSSNYRVYLKDQILEYEEREPYWNLNYEFNVQSINYKKPEGERTVFQYLADIVCGYILSAIRNGFSKREVRSTNGQTVTQVLYNSDGFINLIQPQDRDAYPILIRVYDKADFLYQQLVTSAKAGKLTDCYRMVFTLQNRKMRYRELYAKYWIPQAEEFINGLLQDEDYQRKILHSLPEMYAYIKGCKPDLAKYLAERVLEVMEIFPEDSYTGAYMFYLNDVLLATMNHTGAYENLKEVLRACEEYRDYVPTEEYIYHFFRVVQYYFNSFQYEEIVKLMENLRWHIEKAKVNHDVLANDTSKVMSDILGGDLVDTQKEGKGYTMLGICYSTLGQAYAFLRNYNEAQTMFSKAKGEFVTDKCNWLTTHSYAVQMELDQAEYGEFPEYGRFAYEALVSIAFSVSNNNQQGRLPSLRNQLQEILAESRPDFDLLIFIKALRLFYTKERRTIDVVRTIVEYVEKQKENTLHPWELIFYQLHLLLDAIDWEAKGSDEEEIENMKALSEKYYLFSIGQGEEGKAPKLLPENCQATIQVIMMRQRMLHELKVGKIQLDTKVEDFASEIDRSNIETFFSEAKDGTIADLKKLLDKKVTYQYS